MIKTWQERCEEHPDHEGIVTEQMISDRMQEEIDALRQAIAEAEKQEPVAWMWKDGTLTFDPDFADGTWTPLFTAPVHASDISQECVDETAKGKHEFECPRCGHCSRVEVVT